LEAKDKKPDGALTFGCWPEGVRRAGGVLDRIVEVKAGRVRAAKILSEPGPFHGSTGHRGMSFARSISKPGRVNVIAEIKRRSPSKGVIREDFDPVWIAESYSQAGAAALSILTEEDFFEGSLDYLRAIRSRLPEMPLLRKDFLFDDYQVHESAEAGADAILLIAAILEDARLAALIDAATKAGLDALVEVHTREEMERASRAGARVIGINNRDLTDFSVDIDTSIRLAPQAPSSAILVSESGINSGKDISRLGTAGFHAFLVGEQLMRAPVPGHALERLIMEAGVPA
jgi:indole-3-glycerol phosphate synthase